MFIQLKLCGLTLCIEYDKHIQECYLVLGHSVFFWKCNIFAICFINYIWFSVISFWFAALIYSGQLADRSRCGQWRWQLSCYCWPPRSNPSRCANEEVAGFWRCVAGTAGALCWCCLVGENSGALQLSEEFKFVSGMKWYVWPLVQCVYFVNDLRSSYSCRFVFCGLWRSSLARVELEQYLKPALFFAYMCWVQMNNKAFLVHLLQRPVYYPALW